MAVALAFGLNGLVFASWVSRLPAVRDALDLSPSRLGLLLVAAGTAQGPVLPTGAGLLLVGLRAGSCRSPCSGRCCGARARRSASPSA